MWIYINLIIIHVYIKIVSVHIEILLICTTKENWNGTGDINLYRNSIDLHNQREPELETAVYIEILSLYATKEIGTGDNPIYGWCDVAWTWMWHWLGSDLVVDHQDADTTWEVKKFHSPCLSFSFFFTHVCVFLYSFLWKQKRTYCKAIPFLFFSFCSFFL